MLSLWKYETYCVCHFSGICLNCFGLPLSLSGWHMGAGLSPCSFVILPCLFLLSSFFKLDTKEESSPLSCTCQGAGRLTEQFKTSCFISTIRMTFSPKFHNGCKEMLHCLWYITSGEDLNANQKAIRSQANPIHWTQKKYCGISEDCFWNFTYSICLSRSKTLP